MSGRPAFVAIALEGKVEVHAPGLGSYATLCGLDGDDPDAGQSPAELKRGAKIDCKDCIGIITFAKQFGRRDFKPAQSIGGAK